jgi:hypothetical protein
MANDQTEFLKNITDEQFIQLIVQTFKNLLFECTLKYVREPNHPGDFFVVAPAETLSKFLDITAERIDETLRDAGVARQVSYELLISGAIEGGFLLLIESTPEDESTNFQIPYCIADGSYTVNMNSKAKLIIEGQT